MTSPDSLPNAVSPGRNDDGELTGELLAGPVVDGDRLGWAGIAGTQENFVGLDELHERSIEDRAGGDAGVGA
jgi:hypothetical protein